MKLFLNQIYRYRLYSNHTEEEAIETIKGLLVRRYENGKRIFSGKVSGNTFLIKPEFDMEPRYLLRPEIEGKIIGGEETVIELEFRVEKSIKKLLIGVFCIMAVGIPLSPFIFKYMQEQDMRHPKPVEAYWQVPLVVFFFLLITPLMNNYFLKLKVDSSLEILVKEMRTTKKEELD